MLPRAAPSPCLTLLFLSLACGSPTAAPASADAGTKQTELAPKVVDATVAPPIEDEASAPTAAHFVSLSDLHFDPFLEPALVPKLAAAEAIDWGLLFETEASKRLGPHGQDTGYALLRSALAAPQAADTWPPAYVIISGDFLAHSFRDRYQATTGDDSDAGYHAFVDKTLQFLTAEISASFAGAPIFPALGNNDSYCGDYLLEPGGSFLAMLARAWTPLTRGGPEFAQTFATGGWYEAPHPTLPDHRLIVLNTVFFSRNYANACATGEAQGAVDPSTEQLAWLEQRLRAATAAAHDVSLIYHIPPGINVYGSLHSKATACPQKSELFWRDEVSTAFLALVDQYHEVIVASFAGHIHTDDFRLTYPGAAGGQPSGFVHLTPAISPMFGNNPGFQVFAYDSVGGALRDFTTYALPLGADAPSWRAEYGFRDAYGQDGDYDLAALTRARAQIQSDETIRAKYITYNPVDSPDAKQIDASNARAYWCGTGTMTTSDFSGCLCPQLGPQLGPQSASD